MNRRGTAREEDEKDPFDAFGSDSDEDVAQDVAQRDEQHRQTQTETVIQGVALFLCRHFNPHPMKHVRVGIDSNSMFTSQELMDAWERSLHRHSVSMEEICGNNKSISCFDGDASGECGDNTHRNDDDFDVVICPQRLNARHRKSVVQNVARGGLWVVLSDSKDRTQAEPAFFGLKDQEWKTLFETESFCLPPNQEDVTAPRDCSYIVVQKRPILVQTEACRWLPSNAMTTALVVEQDRLAAATVTPLVRDRWQQQRAQTTCGDSEKRRWQLSEPSLARAVHCLQRCGYCILPQLLDPHVCQQWGNVLLQDLDHAAEILRQRDGVNLYQPHESKQDPATYRELSMREDLRMDVRHGPKWDTLRGGCGCAPWTVTSQEPILRDDPTLERALAQDPSRFFRGHPGLLEIVRRVMNPTDPALSPGNFGRYNFGGGGPDGSWQDLRVGPVGGIVSLPGSADQAVHADTPHLFETPHHLPPHYINAFTPGCAADPRVGQTALVHGSHTLEFCARHTCVNREHSYTDSSEDGWKVFVVRPQLELGDVLLFDCRLLHFGMANTSDNIHRPLLYTNMTQHWFHDPKNWDDQQQIFSGNDGSANSDQNTCS